MTDDLTRIAGELEHGTPSPGALCLLGYHSWSDPQWHTLPPPVGVAYGRRCIHCGKMKPHPWFDTHLYWEPPAPDAEATPGKPEAKGEVTR